MNSSIGPSSRLLARLLVVLTTMCSLLLGGTQTAAAATFAVTSSNCLAVPGGYDWAVQQANATPGKDTIDIQVPVIYVDICVHPHSAEPWLTPITESVEIVGHGAWADSLVTWFNPDGKKNSLGHCPSPTTNDLFADVGAGLLEVGQYGKDNTGIEVTITGLNMRNLVNVAVVRENAKLIIQDTEIKDIFSVWFNSSCASPAIGADKGADVTLINTKFRNIDIPSSMIPDTAFPALPGVSVIFGSDGHLEMQGVEIVLTFGANNGSISPTAVWWAGGTAKIVNSRFIDSGGIFASANAKMEIVNSFYYRDSLSPLFTSNIMALGGATLTTKASTFIWYAAKCKNCLTPGLGFGAEVNSQIRFESTAIGALPTHEKLLFSYPASYSSDAYTWIQVGAQQDATALKAILPNVLTGVPGLPQLEDISQFEAATPVVPGVLIEAVPDAGPGGINSLINPIDHLPITQDVLGNHRVYGNGTRNIGAVQNAEAPVLAATPRDAGVDLSWNTSQGTITGYEICTSTTPLTDPFRSLCPGTSTSVDPTKTKETIGSLTNGSPYWFVIRSENSGTPGIWSNVATATPSGVPGTPVVTATPGDGQAALSWTTPPDNGSPIIGYVVKYRQQGTATWTPWVYSGTGTTTTINSLTNGVTYELEVSALNGSPANIGLGQGQGPFGVTTGTPAKPLSLAYPTPIDAFESVPPSSQTINPAVSNLLGTPTYTLIGGTLPNGMTLNANTGVISGTPAAGSGSPAPGTPYPVTIQISQSGPPAQTTSASLTINVITVSPKLQLIYPDLLNVPVGSGPYSLVPSTTGFTGPIAYSLTGGSLPPGLTLNPTTGVISGTPTTATSGVFTPTIAASAQGGAEFWQNVLEIEILPLLAYPPANAILGTLFTVSPTVSPTVMPGTFSLVGGTLPAGLTLDNLTGRISGTPTTLLSSLVTIQFATGTGHVQTVTANVLIAISGYPISLTYPPSTATIGRPFNLVPTTSGAKGKPTYRVSGEQLPAGLKLNPKTGAITGTATGPEGEYPVGITLTDQYTSTMATTLITVQASPPASIPALSEWGMLLMASLMVLAVSRQSRRRKGL
jgi:hypothetical protein